MSSNLSARNLELLINGDDWSDFVDFGSGIQIGYPEYQMGTGLSLVSGKITLSLPYGYVGCPSDPNPITNPTYWTRGVSISIKAANDSGSLTYLPCSGQALYLLKVPAPPDISDIGNEAKLSLEVGDRASLEDFQEPNKDVTGVVAGTLYGREIIVGNVLDYAGVTNSIPDLTDDLNYPIAKIQGSYVQLAGQVTNSVGYFLYSRTDGVMVAAAVDLTSSSAIASYVTGQDEKLFKFADNLNEQPVAKLICSGIAYDVIPASGLTFTRYEFSTLGSLFPVEHPGSTAVIVSKEITTTYYPFDGSFTRFVQVIQEPLGVIFPIQHPGETILRDSSTTDTKIYYLSDGRIDYSTAITQKPLGVIFPIQHPGETILRDSSTTDTNYVYDITYSYDVKKITVKQVKSLTQEPLGVIFPVQHPGETILRDRKEETTTYTRYNQGYSNDYWNKHVSVREPLGIVFPAQYSGETGLIPSSNGAFDDTNNDGSTTAPAVTYRNPDNDIRERELKVAVVVQLPWNDVYRPRQRSITVDFCISNDQIYRYGLLFNKMLVGRSYGATLATPLSNFWLSSDARPFTEIQVTHSQFGETATVYRFKLDSITWALNGIEAYAMANLILVGKGTLGGGGGGSTVITPIAVAIPHATLTAVAGAATTTSLFYNGGTKARAVPILISLFEPEFLPYSFTDSNPNTFTTFWIKVDNFYAINITATGVGFTASIELADGTPLSNPTTEAEFYVTGTVSGSIQIDFS